MEIKNANGNVLLSNENNIIGFSVKPIIEVLGDMVNVTMPFCTTNICSKCGGDIQEIEDCIYCNGTGEEVVEELNLTFTVINNIAYINTTPHAINGFLDGKDYVIPVSGKIINATISESPVTTKNSIEYVTTKFDSNNLDWNFTWNIKTNRELERMFPTLKDVVIIGSFIAAQAYKGVCALVPVKGFERVEPSKKKMRLDKFTVLKF